MKVRYFNFIGSIVVYRHYSVLDNLAPLACEEKHDTNSRLRGKSGPPLDGIQDTQGAGDRPHLDDLG